MRHVRREAQRPKLRDHTNETSQFGMKFIIDKEREREMRRRLAKDEAKWKPKGKMRNQS